MSISRSHTHFIKRILSCTHGYCEYFCSHMKWSSHIYVSFINDFFMFFFSGKNFPRIFHEKIFNHVWQIPISRPRESIVSLVWNYRLLIGLVVCVYLFRNLSSHSSLNSYDRFWLLSCCTHPISRKDVS